MVGAVALIAVLGIVAAATLLNYALPQTARNTKNSANSASGRHNKSSKHSAHGNCTNTYIASKTAMSPYGLTASWVKAENNKPGTTAWQITTPQSATGIMGYASTQQAQVGQQVTLYVSTQAPNYQIAAYRMGYYKGAGARLIWQSKTLPGVVQPACPVSPGIFEVQCSWTPAITLKITNSWVIGSYLLKLVGSGGQQSYIPLTIWNPNITGAYVIMEPVLTWQAFNLFGGYDLYAGGPPGLSGYPPPDRSRVLSFDRPYAYGNGTADFLTNEYPLIRYMEKHGLDVTYWTDITLAVHGNLLLGQKALLSLGHDEEWSLRMRNAVVAARAAGVNLMFFGASPILRKVRLEPSPIGPNMTEVNYRDPQADPLYGVDDAEVTQNWWGQPPANEPASTIVGSSYIGFNNSTSANMVVVDPTSWVFNGTGLKQGSQIPGVLLTDFNAYIPSRPNPPDVQILTHSPVTIGFSNRATYADTTYYTWGPSGAGIFESGTNLWIASLQACSSSQPNCASPVLRKITSNLLVAFGQGPAGKDHPSVTNWQQFYP